MEAHSWFPRRRKKFSGYLICMGGDANALKLSLCRKCTQFHADDMKDGNRQLDATENLTEMQQINENRPPVTV